MYDLPTVHFQEDNRLNIETKLKTTQQLLCSWPNFWQSGLRCIRWLFHYTFCINTNLTKIIDRWFYLNMHYHFLRLWLLPKYFACKSSMSLFIMVLSTTSHLRENQIRVYCSQSAQSSRTDPTIKHWNETNFPFVKTYPICSIQFQLTVRPQHTFCRYEDKP